MVLKLLIQGKFILFLKIFHLKRKCLFFQSDFNYVDDYVNDDDSDDYKRARGFNYHNGSEWLWLTTTLKLAGRKISPSPSLSLSHPSG
jgi:hypothetical protein